MTSSRSRSAAGISDTSFAVVMNSTSDRSNGTSTNASRNSLCCCGSSTSSSTAADAVPILSSSSSRNTGSRLPTRRSSRRIQPGCESFQVRLWPRNSDSSRSPPQASLRNPRPSARAVHRASDVFPTPGGPNRHSTAPLRGFRRRTARYSRMRDLASSRPACPAFRAARMPARSDTAELRRVHGSRSSHSIQSVFVAAAADEKPSASR